MKQIGAIYTATLMKGAFSTFIVKKQYIVALERKLSFFNIII